MNIKLVPELVLKYLLFLIFFLLLANILGLVATFYFNHDTVYGLVKLFRLDAEKNIPTLWSSFSLIIAFVLLILIMYIHKKNDRPYLYWFFLAIIFLFLSIDEMSSIHERLIEPTRKLINVSGLLYYAWVVPYSIALIIFIAAYSKFLINLPKKIMILFIISGSVFVLGAIGFELLGGQEVELNGSKSILYNIFSTCEEFLEMLGIVIFIYTLLLYIEDELGLKMIITNK